MSFRGVDQCIHRQGQCWSAPPTMSLVAAASSAYQAWVTSTDWLTLSIRGDGVHGHCQWVTLGGAFLGGTIDEQFRILAVSINENG